MGCNERSDWPRALALGVLLLGMGALPARAALLEFDSRGLAWSVAAVRAATETDAPAGPATEPATDSVGCRTHCPAIDRAWARLLRAVRMYADVDQSPAWQLTVSQRADVEAQALPSGRVVIGEPYVRERGLDEAQIAFVLAHEIAHVLHQHERQLLTAALALLPRGVNRSVADIYVEMDFNLALMRQLAVVMHQTEFEADETGLYLAALAGYEPAGALRYLQQEAGHALHAPTVVSTHPEPKERLDQASGRVPLALRLVEHARGDASLGTHPTLADR